MVLEDERQMQCTFVAGQIATGDVLVFCEFKEPFGVQDHQGANSFTGTTDQGHRLSAKGENGQGITWCPFISDCEGCWYAFRVRELKVEMLGRAIEKKFIRFGLTNLTFSPQDTDKSGKPCLRIILESASERTELSIIRLPGYQKIVEYFRISGATTDLTSEVVIDITETTNAEHPEIVVDNLCHLLSLARGTQIQWIYFDLYDGNGQLFQRNHFSRRTKPCDTHPLIDLHGASETKEFLQQSYKTYVEKRDSYRLNRGLITSYLEAKSSDDNIERKGVKLAVTLEMLKTLYLELPENLEKEFIVDKDVFTRLIPFLQNRINRLLTAANIDKSCRGLVRTKGKIRGLNRISFSDVLLDLCKDIKLDVSDDDLKHFVECRNSLIHRGRFHCSTQTPSDNNAVLNEFGFMLHFVDRIFLKLLGYSGPYLDCSSQRKVS